MKKYVYNEKIDDELSEEKKFKCVDCGWEGLGAECNTTFCTVYNRANGKIELTQFLCPVCSKELYLDEYEVMDEFENGI